MIQSPKLFYGIAAERDDHLIFNVERICSSTISQTLAIASSATDPSNFLTTPQTSGGTPAEPQSQLTCGSDLRRRHLTLTRTRWCLNQLKPNSMRRMECTPSRITKSSTSNATLPVSRLLLSLLKPTNCGPPWRTVYALLFVGERIFLAHASFTVDLLGIQAPFGVLQHPPTEPTPRCYCELRDRFCACTTAA